VTAITSLVTDFETHHILANVNSTNNKFYYSNEKIVIPEGLYKLRYRIDMKREILRSHDVKVKEDEECPLVIRADNNMMANEIKCAYRINFEKSHNSLLRFSSNRVQKPRQWTSRRFVHVAVRQFFLHIEGRCEEEKRSNVDDAWK